MGDSGGKFPPAASPHPNSQQREGVAQKARETQLKSQSQSSEPILLRS